MSGIDVIERKTALIVELKIRVFLSIVYFVLLEILQIPLFEVLEDHPAFLLFLLLFLHHLGRDGSVQARGVVGLVLRHPLILLLLPHPL